MACQMGICILTLAAILILTTQVAYDFSNTIPERISPVPSQLFLMLETSNERIISASVISAILISASKPVDGLAEIVLVAELAQILARSYSRSTPPHLPAQSLHEA